MLQIDTDFADFRKCCISLGAIIDTPMPRSSVTLRSVGDEGSWAIVVEKAMVLPKGGARFLTVARFARHGSNDGMGIWRYQRFHR